MGTFLKNRDFRWITMSDWFSVIGDSIFYLALISFASTLSNPGLAISLVTISETVPDALSFVAGYLCDKTKKKYIADITCSFFRAVLYIIIAILFINTSGWGLLLSVVSLNFVSDFLGCYSDNLRFPEIYAVVPEDEFESSNGFSSGIYYSFDIIAKMLGGVILISLDYNYVSFASINAITFVICGVCLLIVKKSVQYKIDCVEEEEEEETSTLLNEFRKLKENKELFHMIMCFTLLNMIVGSISTVIYIILANDMSLPQETYTIFISVINVVSVVGIILGNLVSEKIFKNHKIEILIKIELLIILCTIISIFWGNLHVIVILFAVLFFIEGVMSIKFTSFLYSNQEYKRLGISVGLTNTMLTIVLPLFLGVVSLIGNILSFTYALTVILGITIFCFIRICLKWN